MFDLTKSINCYDQLILASQVSKTEINPLDTVLGIVGVIQITPTSK
jgi:hypothetical protein